MSSLELVTNERSDAWRQALDRLQELATRRIKGEPVWRILGAREFYGLTFRLNAATLVPRPETELLVGKVLELIEKRGKRRLLDLGTGTGCIPIAALAHNLQLTAVAIDVAEDAAQMARDNAEAHGVERRLDVRVGSWFEPLGPREVFDVIVSNPPYIATGVIETLAREVKEHDPRAALDGGADGLEAYRAILKGARGRLRADGALVVEIGADQGRAVKRMFEEAGFLVPFIEKDLAGLDRMVVGHHS